MKYRVFLLCIIFQSMTFRITVATDAAADVGSAHSWESPGLFCTHNYREEGN